MIEKVKSNHGFGGENKKARHRIQLEGAPFLSVHFIRQIASRPKGHHAEIGELRFQMDRSMKSISRNKEGPSVH
jgi:hypothetical protein